MTIAPWASHPLAGGVNQALAALEAGMHVALIGTFDLKTCDVSDAVEQVLTNPQLQAFDYIPVRDGDNIVGVWHRPRHEGEKIVGLVGEAMQPLDELMLIQSHASILSFVKDADRIPYRLVLDGRVVGIVTQSDLQKFAMRPVLFSLITCVELLLAEWVRQKCPDEKDWLATLSEGRSTLIEHRWLDWSPGNMAMDKLSVSEFCDKRELAISLGAFPSKSAAKKKLKFVEWLRHAVMHSGDYALTPENAQYVAYAVRCAQELIQMLQDSLEIPKS